MIAAQVGLLLMVIGCVFAVLKGGPPERAAALLIALTWLGLLAGQALIRQTVPELLFLASDVIPAVGFLLLAIRYASIWLGVMMILESALFFLHANHLAEPPRHSYGYLVAVNVLSYCVLFTLIGATMATLIKRRRAGRLQRDNSPKSGTLVTGL